MLWIDRCLLSCEGYPVIIVDNASTDDTVRFVQENYPSVILLSQTKNLGFGAANNLGISYALKNNAAYVFLLNQDAYLESNTIATLIDIHKKNSVYGVLSPIHLNGSGLSLDLNFSNYINVNKSLQYDSLKHNFLKTVYDVPFVNAAAWLLPRHTLEVVGGFDSLFFHYGEDDNYCHRVLFHGLSIGVSPLAFVKHDRELRGGKGILNDDEKLNLKVRAFKLRWANININNFEDVFNEKRKLKRLLIKLFIRLKWGRMRYYLKELRLFNNVIPEIYKSRTLNKNKGSHYL